MKAENRALIIAAVHTSFDIRFSSIPAVNNRIMFVSTCCWSLYNFRSYVLQYFVEQGYEVHVVGIKDDYADELERIGCIVHDIPLKNTLDPFKWLKAKTRLAKLYAHVKPSMIFHYSHLPILIGSSIAARLCIRNIAIVTGRGQTLDHAKRSFPIVRSFFRKAYRHADQVWCLNDADIAFMKEHKLVNAERISLLKSEGVNVTELVPKKIPSEQFRFVMCTRLIRSKGIQEFIEAARSVRQRFNATFTIAGIYDQEHPDSVNKYLLVDAINEGLIEYHDHVKDISNILAQADCFVLPTYYNEGVPRSIMEACSMQVPVITTDIPGCNDLVEHGQNGLLCDPKKVASLVAAMEKMILMPVTEKIAMGYYGRQKMILEFNIEKIIACYQMAVDHHISYRPQRLEPVA